MSRILIVDDDRDLVDLLTFALRRAGLEPVDAYDPDAALKAFERHKPDLIVLDVNLAGASGLQLLRDLRRKGQVPVIMLTALDAEDDKVHALELGADDYVTKPFSHRELIARIRVQLRKAGQNLQLPTPSNSAVAVGPLTLNVAEYSAVLDGTPVNLSLTEFRVLHYLAINAGTAVPTRAILRQVWGYDDASAADVVRVTIHRLRRKLDDQPDNPRLLHTLPGVGFMLKAN